MTHTYVLMTLSSAAYEEIRGKMLEAAFTHALHDNGVIDLTGIGVLSEVGKPEDPPVMQAGIKPGGELEKAIAEATHSNMDLGATPQELGAFGRELYEFLAKHDLIDMEVGSIVGSLGDTMPIVTLTAMLKTYRMHGTVFEHVIVRADGDPDPTH